MSDDEEWSSLRTATTALNEMFVTMLESGFTEEQALRLVPLLMLGTMFTDNDD